MQSYLIVEDHASGINELSRLLLRRKRPQNLRLEFVCDVRTALEWLETRYDAVIIDVMLPSFDGIHKNDEGIYLAAWILGFKTGLPSSLGRQNRPAWMDSQPCPIVLLTSRDPEPVKGLICSLDPGHGGEGVLIVERTEDVICQVDSILAFLDRRTADDKG